MRHFKKVRPTVGAFFESMGQQVTLDIAGAFSNICSAAHTRSIFELGTWAALVSTSLYFPKNGSEKWAKPFAVDEYACGWYTKGDSEAQKILNEMSAANKF
jgi:hypothetical protein